jgi:hypothetical protein
MIWMLGIPLAFFLGGRSEPFSSGMTGFSGSSGSICTACHSGGIVPTVTLSGPTTVAPNTIHTYMLRISGGQQNHGGLDVFASGGALSVIDGGTQLLGSEITHTTPRPAVAGVVTFSFNWQAPALPGTITIFGAGNSVNRDFTNSGDNAAAATLQISVQSAGGGTPGESAATGLQPLLVTDYDSATGDLSISFESGCGTDDNNVYYGSLDQVSTYAWSDEICSVGTTGSASINPVGDSVFFVVVGNKSGNEGSYGRDSDDIERTPFGLNTCGEAQDLSDACVP